RARCVDPVSGSRLEDWKRVHGVRHQPRPDGTVQITTGLTVAPIPYDRFPGEAPREEHTKAVPGARTALEGRVSSHHRQAVQPGVDEENAAGRLVDMELEGRDIDFMFPCNWAASLTPLDVTLAQGLCRASHRA